jgi:hypothetical protein
LIIVEFFQQRMICFGSDQMIDHIHGGGEKGFDAGLCGSICHAFGQIAFADAGIADQNDVLLLPDKLQVRKERPLRSETATRNRYSSSSFASSELRKPSVTKRWGIKLKPPLIRRMRWGFKMRFLIINTSLWHL